MNEPCTLGTQVQTCGAQGVNDAPICPEYICTPPENPELLKPSDPIPQPSPAGQSAPEKPIRPAQSIQPLPQMESLVHKLSRQSLRTRSPERSWSLPPMPVLPTVMEPASFESRVDASLDLDLDLPMDKTVAELPSSHSARDRRQQRDNSSDVYHSNSRTIESLVENMIASGTQCNVYESPLSTPTSAYLIKQGKTVEPIIPVSRDIIEPALPGEQMDMTCSPLEVDEGYCEELDDMLWVDSVMSIRRASMLGAIRKSGVLTYRTSADSAMQCRNLVRNVPRLRKRRRTEKDRDKSSRASVSSDSQPQPPP